MGRPALLCVCVGEAVRKRAQTARREPSRENAAPGGPQTFRYHKIKIILLRFSTKISEDVEKSIGECIFLRKNVVK